MIQLHIKVYGFEYTVIKVPVSLMHKHPNTFVQLVYRHTGSVQKIGGFVSSEGKEKIKQVSPFFFLPIVFFDHTPIQK